MISCHLGFEIREVVMEITSATTSGILAGIHQLFNQCCNMTKNKTRLTGQRKPSLKYLQNWDTWTWWVLHSVQLSKSKFFLSQEQPVNKVAMSCLPSSWKTPPFTILNDLNTAPSSNMECESGGMEPENRRQHHENIRKKFSLRAFTSCFHSLARRQRDRVVKAPDLKTGGYRFKSRSDHLALTGVVSL